MNSRPTSVTVISWIAIVLGAISIFSSYFTMQALTDPNSPAAAMVQNMLLPASAQIALGLLASAVLVICGIFWLQGKDWARKLYVAYTIFSLLVAVINLIKIPALIPMALIGLIVNVIFIIFLYRQPANRFFTGKGESEIQQVFH